MNITDQQMTHLRIVTDQFEYLEVDFLGTTDEAYREYRRLKAIVAGGEGISEKEFNNFYDEYRTTGKIQDGADVYARMNVSQQAAVQLLKRSIARTK